MTKWLGITIIFFFMSCSKNTFTLYEVQGTYYEVQTKNSQWKKECVLIVTDTTVILKNCSFFKDFIGKKIRIVDGNRLVYILEYSYPNQDIHLPSVNAVRDTVREYSKSFKIFEKDGVIHLYDMVEEHEEITFRKVE
jgi:hypothetical protein